MTTTTDKPADFIVVVCEHTEDGAYTRYVAGPFTYEKAREVCDAAKPNDYVDWEGYGWSTQIDRLDSAERFLANYADDAAERRRLNPSDAFIHATGEEVL